MVHVFYFLIRNADFAVMNLVLALCSMTLEFRKRLFKPSMEVCTCLGDATMEVACTACMPQMFSSGIVV